jgi:hypothetical protein
MVEVIVRVRPLSLYESANPNIRHIITCLDGSIIVDSGRDPAGRQGGPFGKSCPPRARQFYVDNVLHQDCTQIELYDCRCRDVAMSVFQGVNGAILAYGATGSGKTHSMFGGEMSAAGIVYQAMQDIFEEKLRLETQEGKFVQITCNFLEVYNEDVFDLLSPGGRAKLQVLDAGNGGEDGGTCSDARRANPESLKVRGLNTVLIRNMEDLALQMEMGHRNRFTAATHANAVSSRSHAIITVEVEVRQSLDAASGTFARLRMCDLAGSERAASTSNSGQRLTEGGNINKSLLALGTVVQALAKNKCSSAQVFVPYRGSKLTRLLKDCLGGNCRTLMLFCVSPSSLVCEETINTMLFAMQAKEIQVAAQRNEFTVNVQQVAKEQELLVEKLRHELATAKEEVNRLRAGIVTSDPPATATVSDSQTLRSGRSDSPAGALSSPISAPPRGSGAERSALQLSLESIVRKKEELRRAQKDAEETCIDIDNRIREHAAKIADYVGSTTLMMGSDEASLQAPPVGIAGSYQEMSRLRSLLESNRQRATALQEEHDEIDVKATNIINDIRHEKQNPLLELQLENARLQKTIVEAECLAAFYHQKYTALATKERNEWRPAAAQCVMVLKELAAMNDVSAEAKLRAHLAVAKTTVPYSATDDILEMHQKYILSALEGRPQLNSQIHRSSGIICANPFSSSDKGHKDSSFLACATAAPSRSGAGVVRHRPPLGCSSPAGGGGSAPANVAFGRALSTSPLTSPAALQSQIKKFAAGITMMTPASVLASVGGSGGVVGAGGGGGGACGTKQHPYRSINSPGVSSSPIVERLTRIAAKSPVLSLNGQPQQQLHADAMNMNVTGSAIRPQPNQLVRLNTAFAALGVAGVKRGSPPPKLEKENASTVKV